MIKQYITVPAIVTDDHKIYPLWSEDVKYSFGDDYCSDSLKLKDNYREYFNIQNVILDIKTKKLSLGIDIDIYPTKLEFNIGDKVLYELRHKVLKHSEIKNIVYEEYESQIYKGKDIEDSYYERYINSKELKVNDLYHIKVWKPYYVMIDDKIIKWEHQLYKYEI